MLAVRSCLIALKSSHIKLILRKERPITGVHADYQRNNHFVMDHIKAQNSHLNHSPTTSQAEKHISVAASTTNQKVDPTVMALTRLSNGD
jgi:hypothetical protein